MTIPDSAGRRNMPGLKALRGRYLRRAKTVSVSEEFIEDIRKFRAVWNRPRVYTVYPVASFEELDSSSLIASTLKIYLPAQLADDWKAERLAHPEAFEFWFELINGIAERYFPAKYFSGYSPTYTHFEVPDYYNNPARAFVSACFFCDPAIVGRHADTLIEDMSVGVWSFAHRPHASDPYRIASLKAQLDFLKSVVVEDRGRDGLQEAMEKAREEADRATERLAERCAAQDPAKRWWYIPLFPGISAVDLREASGEAVEMIGNTYGVQSVDEITWGLRSEGLGLTEIAALLGIDRETVRVALNNKERNGRRHDDGFRY